MNRLFLTAAVGFALAGVGVLVVRPAAGPAEAAASSAPLGDLSAMSAIVADAQGIAATGDLVAAERRITDLETAWDAAQPTLQPRDPTAWSAVDGAADEAFGALRAARPDPGQVTATLAALSAELAHPTGAGGGATPVFAADGSVNVADAAGRPLPCETMAAALRGALAAAVPADPAQVADLQARGLERCNADDDARADAFFAQALALLPRS